MHFAFVAALTLALQADTRVWEDEIVYAIIIEKFFDGDSANNEMRNRFLKDRAHYEGGFWGGDLAGVIAKLDDLADLGITAILLYPVVQNDEKPVGKFLPTGYRPKDYEHVDRNFGDTDRLRALVDAAHARSLRVILDMPITFPGFEHPYVVDPSKKSWFGPVSEYGVRRWKVENPEVADYLIGVCKRWKERSSCDGFRIDSAHLQPISFWKRFVAELKEAPPAGPFLVLPELTVNPREIGRFVSEAGFDGAYDFSALRVRDVFGTDHADAGALAFIAREAKEYYPSPRAMMAPIDNYEKAFVTSASEPKQARTKLAITYILMLDRVPLLYAGNELGIAFHDVGGAFPADRRDSAFKKHVQRLIALRRREQALRSGDFFQVLAREHVYAYLRTSGEDRILVILNGSDRTIEFAMHIGDLAWKECGLEDLVSDALAKPANSDAAIEVKPFDARILKIR